MNEVLITKVEVAEFLRENDVVFSDIEIEVDTPFSYLTLKGGVLGNPNTRTIEQLLFERFGLRADVSVENQNDLSKRAIGDTIKLYDEFISFEESYAIETNTRPNTYELKRTRKSLCDVLDALLMQ